MHWEKSNDIVTVCYIRPDFEDLKSQLVGLGANYVVTEEELKSSEMKKTMKVRLRLNSSFHGNQNCHCLEHCTCKRS